eukprot:scaffold32899_cov68-Phaeocystis_antarctica.AAC.6
MFISTHPIHDGACRGEASHFLATFGPAPAGRERRPVSFLQITRDHVPRRTDQCNLHTHVIANFE